MSNLDTQDQLIVDALKAGASDQAVMEEFQVSIEKIDQLRGLVDAPEEVSTEEAVQAPVEESNGEVVADVEESTPEAVENTEAVVDDSVEKAEVEEEKA